MIANRCSYTSVLSVVEVGCKSRVIHEKQIHAINEECQQGICKFLFATISDFTSGNWLIYIYIYIYKFIFMNISYYIYIYMDGWMDG